MLEELAALVRFERDAQREKVREVWRTPLSEKLQKGLTQKFSALRPASEANHLWAHLDEGESRFREGDMLILYVSHPEEDPLVRQAKLLSEEDDRWLLEVESGRQLFQIYRGGPCHGDADELDLTDMYEQAFEELRRSRSGRNVILPLLRGDLQPEFEEALAAEAEERAREDGLNEKQRRAVQLAHTADHIVCIQGPPGTGKTRVLSLIAQLAVERGERVLVTSHTHMAINNALSKVAARGVPTVKVGSAVQHRGLVPEVARVERMASWDGCSSESGYVVGATPFATCSSRLKGYSFDLVIFDEASQVTVPLAVMAMRVGTRFVFIGDDKQLPPVLLSRSILAAGPSSVFSLFSSREAKHSIMLDETHRMNAELTLWPSTTYYGGALRSVGKAGLRRFELPRPPARHALLLSSEHSAMFVPTQDVGARSRSDRDAELVADICCAAFEAGLPIEEAAVVTPYRAQGRAIRRELAARLGFENAKRVVADTVERMQGQEREMIILSLATGDQVFLGLVASFFFQPERLNVSITRAKTKLIIIGPEPQRMPAPDDEVLQAWIVQYRELVEQCARVEV